MLFFHSDNSFSRVILRTQFCVSSDSNDVLSLDALPEVHAIIYCSASESKHVTNRGPCTPVTPPSSGTPLCMPVPFSTSPSFI